MKMYRGRRTVHDCVVEWSEMVADGKTKTWTPLQLRLDLASHSPTGFEWGYWGSGPAQLALAILANFLQDDQEAFRLHQEFKMDVVAKLDRDRWSLTGAEVEQALAKIRSRIP